MPYSKGDEFQISTIKFILHNSLTQCSIFRAVKKTDFLNRLLVYIYLPKASKYLYGRKMKFFKFTLCPTVRGITLHLKG
jgi:hypothetical protein